MKTHEVFSCFSTILLFTGLSMVSAANSYIINDPMNFPMHTVADLQFMNNAIKTIVISAICLRILAAIGEMRDLGA